MTGRNTRIFENWEIKLSWPDRIWDYLTLFILTIISGGEILPALIPGRRKTVTRMSLLEGVVEAKPEILTGSNFGLFMMSHYQRWDDARRGLDADWDGECEQLSEALLYASETSPHWGTHSQSLSVFFFARVAKLRPHVSSYYRDLLQEVLSESRHFILAVLYLATGDKTHRLPLRLDDHFPTNVDILQRSVVHPKDLDYLWVEFFVTGSKEPLRRIINVLRWPDLIRGKLSEWLRTPKPGFLDRWKGQRVCQRLRKAAGIDCDFTSRTITTTEDLDCLCTLESNLEVRDVKGFDRIRQALPFELSDSDIVYMVTKGTARWSLFSNAEEHSLVREICREELNW